MSKLSGVNTRCYFYKRQNRKIEPVKDDGLNKLAQDKLREIYKRRKALKIPKRYLLQWDKISLYNPNGDVNKASAIILDIDQGAYNLNNQLNCLTSKEWLKFSCSWFIFNALPMDLKLEKELDSTIEHHPATFSPTMISKFIEFFTKERETVLDPFCGIGSTLEACKRTGRVGYGIELNKKYYQLCIKRTPQFKNNIFNKDALKIKDLNLPTIDFCISSPPYWDILTRSTHKFRSTREKRELDVKYSTNDNDLGNIRDYNTFLQKICNVYLDIYNILRKKGFLVIIVKNIKKGGKIYPLAWDIARELSKKYLLKDERIWIQDKVALAPYGYPFSWASNIIHHYCIVLQKDKQS